MWRESEREREVVGRREGAAPTPHPLRCGPVWLIRGPGFSGALSCTVYQRRSASQPESQMTPSTCTMLLHPHPHPSLYPLLSSSLSSPPQPPILSLFTSTAAHAHLHPGPCVTPSTPHNYYNNPSPIFISTATTTHPRSLPPHPTPALSHLTPPGQIRGGDLLNTVRYI